MIKMALTSLGVLGMLALGSTLALAGGSTQTIGGATIHMAADYNQDGKVTLAEHLAWAKTVFEEMDSNGDGFLDTQELAMYRARQLESKRSPKAGENSANEPNQGQPPIMSNLLKFPPEVDTDGDGKVSLAEHLAFETLTFKGMANADGVITAKEILVKDKQVRAELDRKLRLLREQNKASQENTAKFDYQK